MNNTESTTATTQRFIRSIRSRREEQEGSKKGRQEDGSEKGMVKKSVEDDCGARVFRRPRAIPASVGVETGPI